MIFIALLIELGMVSCISIVIAGVEVVAILINLTVVGCVSLVMAVINIKKKSN